jgi:ribonuclease VapC
VILDTSVVVALSLRETSCGWIEKTLAARPQEALRMSWVNIAETGIVLQRLNPMAGRALEQLLSRVGVESLGLDHDVVSTVIEARGRFPLNFGDCFAYAHASLRNEALLTLDADFLKTDLANILHPDRAS